MPTLATGPRAGNPRPAGSTAGRRHSTGFTLVEIMIVVFIIGLMTAGVIITYGGESRDDELDEESERINALLVYVREQAELQTRDYGFFINRRNYSFVVFDPGTRQWRVVEEDQSLRERAIPEGLIPGLVIEGRPVVLDSKRPTITDFKPQVMIFANGDLSSFEVSLEREGGGTRARIYTDENSNIRLALPDKPEVVSDGGRTVRLQ